MFKIIAALFCFVGAYLALGTYVPPFRSVVFTLYGFGFTVAFLCAATLMVATYKAIK